MATQTQTFRSSAAPSTIHTVYNVTSPGTANTEFSQALSNGTKQLLIRCRSKNALQFTFTSGESGTNFITLSPNCVYKVIDLNLTDKTIYMQTEGISVVVEIEEWS